MKKHCAIGVVVLAFSLLISFAGAQENDNPVLKGPYLGQEPPGDTPVVFAPGVVSTGKEHSAAMFTPDGKEIWFGRLYPSVIYFMKITDGSWTDPQIAPFSDSATNSLYPVLAPDGNQIFFSSKRSLDDAARKLPGGDYHIWVTKRSGDQWSEPVHLDENVNFGLDVGEHTPHHVALATQGFMHHHRADALGRRRRHVVRSVVVYIDHRSRQLFAKGRDHFGDRRFLVVAGNENGDSGAFRLR